MWPHPHRGAYGLWSELTRELLEPENLFVVEASYESRQNRSPGTGQAQGASMQEQGSDVGPRPVPGGTTLGSSPTYR